MPDASTALSIIGNALNGPAASGGSPSVVPDVPFPGETPQQATARTIANASAPSPAAGSLSINDKLAILEQGKQGKFDYTPAPSREFSAARTVGNVGAGFNEGLAATAGAPVDAATWMLNNFGSPERVRRFVTGEGNTPLITNPVGGSQSIKQGYGAATQAAGLPNGNPDAYPANNDIEKIARAGGQGVASMVLPFGAARTAGALGAAPTSALGRGLMDMGGGTLRGNAAVGAGAGVGGQVAANAVPDDYKPLANTAGQLLGGGATALGGAGINAVGRGVGDLTSRLTAPMHNDWNLGSVSIPGRQTLAGQRLASAASDAGGVKALLDEGAAAPLVPGSNPTLAQATGDQGLLGLERGQATRNPDPFLARRAEQNAARVSALDSTAPAGSQSSTVTDYISRLRDTEDQNTSAMIQRAQDNARAKVGALGGGAPVDQYGSILRDELASAKASAKANESRLWQAIDPNGSLQIDATPAADAAKAITSAMPRLGKPMSGEESDIFQSAQSLPDVVPFSEFSAFRSRVLDAIRNERFTNGETPALRRLQQLRSSLDNTIAGAGANADASVQSPAAAPSFSRTAENAPAVGANVYTPSGRGIATRYEVVEGNSLVPSHTQDLTENPAYPSELQPRERSRLASETQIAGIASKMQPERLGPSPSAGEGAPIVGRDGVVESGNARTLGILRAYQQNGQSAQAYRDYLKAQGFNTEGMQAPVLVRRRLTDLTPDERIRFSQEANSNPGLAMSATEKAAVDAGRLTPDIVDLFKGGDLNSAENRPFLRAFAKSVLDKGEEGSFVTADGRLSVDGLRRVENALLSKAYGNADLVASLAETGDENIRGFGNALKDASGSIAQLNSDIAAGRVPPEFNISGPLVEAAQLVQKARATRTPLANLVAQSDAFSRISPVAETFLKAAYGNNLGGRLNRADFSRLLGFYVDEAGKQSTEAQLFANVLTPQQIISAGARGHGLFDQATSSAIASPSNARFGESNGTLGQGTRGLLSGEARPGTPGAEPVTKGLLGSESPIANFGRDNAATYRAAADATRNRAQTFGTGPVGQVLRKGQAGLEYNLTDSRVAAKFFRTGAGSLEDAESLVKAVGSRPRAIAAIQDYAATDLVAKASRPDGTLDPAKYARWAEQHVDALRAFPELAKRFRDAASAENAITDAMAARKASLDAVEKGAAGKFLGSDPVNAVDTVLRSKDPAAAMRELRGTVGGNEEALGGLKRAIIESAQRKAVGNELAGQTESTFLKSDTFQTWVKRNDAALAEIFSPDEMDNLHAIAADLQRANRSVTGGKLPGGPGTAQDLHASAKSGKAAGEGHGSNLLSYFIAQTVEHVTGHPLVAAAAFVAKPLVSAVRNAGLSRTDDLVTEALLNPELARTLLEKVPAPELKRQGNTLAAQLKRLSVAGAMSPLQSPNPQGREAAK